MTEMEPPGWGPRGAIGTVKRGFDMMARVKLLLMRKEDEVVKDE